MAFSPPQGNGTPRKVLQHQSEIEQFVELAKREGVSSYLEIGSRWGGSLWYVANALPQGTRIVAVDLPADDGKKSHKGLRVCVESLKERGYDAHMFLGDSTDDAIVNQVRKLGPFDLCFIDGNHGEPYIWKDWYNYGAISRIVAFHDIAWGHGRLPGRLPVDVPEVWNKIKQHYRWEEIKLDPSRKDHGIGILWR